jgi:hypothetical protein
LDVLESFHGARGSFELTLRGRFAWGHLGVERRVVLKGVKSVQLTQ